MEGLLGADTLASMLRIATPLTLAGLGGLLCQRAGVFNIALEGFMLVGAFASIAFVAAFGGSAWIGMLGAVAAGLLVAALFALSMVRFKANAIIAGIAVNLFALGLTAYLLRSAFGVQGRLHPANLRKLDPVLLPGIDQVPFLGQVVSGQSLMTWLSIALVVATQVLLFRTRKGLEICAVGQSEDAARTAGINPDAIRLQVVLASGALCGLAGFYLSTEMVSQFSENMVQGRGFTAFTAVVFGGAHPVAVWLVTLLFGLADAVGIRIELAGTGIPPSIVKMFPFLLALLVLTVSSAAEQRRARGRSGPRKARARATAG